VNDQECKACGFPSGYLYVVENTEPRIFLNLNGRYIQIFNEEYPGWIDNFQINYCPMCGRRLAEQDAKEEE